jgi:hypothetical protein
MSTHTSSTAQSVEFWACQCCIDHSDTPLVANRKVNCPECGQPCSCPGCIAEQGHV